MDPRMLESIEAIPALLELSKHNDVTGLTTFLEEHPNVNINHIKFENEKTFLEIVYTQRHFLEFGQAAQKPKSGVSQKTLDEIARAQEKHPLPNFEQTTKEPITDTQKGKALESKNPSATEPSPKDLQEKSDAFFQLVLKKSNIHARLVKNQTFLHLFIFHEEKPPLIDIVYFLLLGADPNLKDAYNDTPRDYLEQKYDNTNLSQDETIENPLKNHLLLLTHGIEYYLSDDKIESLYDMLVEEKRKTSDTNQDDKTLRSEIIEFLKPLINNFPIMPDVNGQTLLHRAIENGNEEKSLQLIETEFNPDIIEIQDNAGNTPLHIAIMKGRYSIVKALFEREANITILNKDNQTPIDIACDPRFYRFYNHDILIEIIERFDLNKETINSIFYTACFCKDADIIEALVTEYSAQIEASEFIEKIFRFPRYSDFIADTLYILIKNNIIQKEQFDYHLFFKEAIRHQHINLMSVLIDETLANECLQAILVKDQEEAAWINQITSHRLKCLLENTTTFDVSTQRPDGDTLLHGIFDLISKKESSLWAPILLNQGADPNTKNNKGFSPLHKAVQKLNPDIVEMLLDSGADPLLESTSGIIGFFGRSTPLGYARGLSKDNDSGLPPLQDCYRPLKKLFDTDTYLGKNPTFSERFMHFFSRFFPRINYTQKHLHYLLNKTPIEEIHYKLKKPYPALLKTLIQYTIDKNRSDVLKTILIHYSDAQLSFLKTDTILAQKIVAFLNLKENPIAPDIKLNILKKLKKSLPPSDIQEITCIEKTIKIEENIFRVLALKGKPAFFEKRMLYFQMIKAVNDNNFAAVKELFDKNPSYNFNIKDKEGRALLDVVYTRNLKYEIALEEKTPPQELQSDEEYIASKNIFMLLLGKLDINSRTINNKTLLQVAIEQHAPMEDIAIFLLMGANRLLKDATGNDAIAYLCKAYGTSKESILPYNPLFMNRPLNWSSELLDKLANAIGTEKLKQLDSFSSFPSSNKPIVKDLLERAEQHQSPTLNPQC